MKLFKGIVIGCSAPIVLMLMIGLFTKKKYAVKREIIINRSKEEIFDYVKYLRNQENYSKWAMMDPLMKKSYRGEDGMVGFVATWDSENDEVGAGEQEIKNIVEGERIDFELRFLRPFEAREPAFITTESFTEDQTNVTWGFSGHMSYPSNLWLLFIDFEEIIGDDLSAGLAKLKAVLEDQNKEGQFADESTDQMQ